MIFRTTFGRYDEEEDDSSRIAGGRFRSRFLRGDDDDESGGNRSSMYDESGDKNKNKVERVKVVDTEDCSRGPLSGCIRLADSSRVIQRLKVSILDHDNLLATPLFGGRLSGCGKQIIGVNCPLKHWSVTSKLV